MSKVVLVTGASSGIGRSIALNLHQNGFVVYGTSRTPNNYKDLPFELLALDLHKSQTFSAVLDQIIAKHDRLDVLVNNAGAGITGPLEETPIETSKAAFETNFFGPIALLNAVLPQMRQQKYGLVINITSIAAYMGLPFRGVYSATKSALEVITEAYRMELAPFNVQLTAVAPGDFATNIAESRFHTPAAKASPYHDDFQKTLRLMDDHVHKAKNPQPMADMVLKIINTSQPKPHYRVGTWLQKFSIVLKMILPQKVYERLIMRHYNL
ncbi:MAG: SDR family oxidoreductase [Flavobacteriaceae bacterium]|nr:SDR family oxidoreductase [Flavobacteriaceae bacterium]MDG1961767.1 SDR family oxidoreductase [Flavobacteriaceae bacterium]